MARLLNAVVLEDRKVDHQAQRSAERGVNHQAFVSPFQCVDHLEQLPLSVGGQRLLDHGHIPHTGHPLVLALRGEWPRGEEGGCGCDVSEKGTGQRRVGLFSRPILLRFAPVQNFVPTLSPWYAQ
eukprot:1443562-Rhodomonas_salina.4